MRQHGAGLGTRRPPGLAPPPSRRKPRRLTRSQERDNNKERPKQVHNNAQRACTRFCCWRVHHDDVLTPPDRNDAPCRPCEATELDGQVRSTRLTSLFFIFYRPGVQHDCCRASHAIAPRVLDRPAPLEITFSRKAAMARLPRLSHPTCRKGRIQRMTEQQIYSWIDCNSETLEKCNITMAVLHRLPDGRASSLVPRHATQSRQVVVPRKLCWHADSMHDHGHLRKETALFTVHALFTRLLEAI